MIASQGYLCPLTIIIALSIIVHQNLDISKKAKTMVSKKHLTKREGDIECTEHYGN